MICRTLKGEYNDGKVDEEDAPKSVVKDVNKVCTSNQVYVNNQQVYNYNVSPAHNSYNSIKY